MLQGRRFTTAGFVDFATGVMASMLAVLKIITSAVVGGDGWRLREVVRW
jgi:hypothetical protein